MPNNKMADPSPLGAAGSGRFHRQPHHHYDRRFLGYLLRSVRYLQRDGSDPER